MLGNGPVQFEKGVTEKVREEPRRYPTSFGIGGGEGDLSADHTIMMKVN